MSSVKFEEALARLKDIVAELEVGSLSLDDAMARYEEALKLVKVCNDRLETAEQKVRILVESTDGSITDKDFIGENEA